MNLKTTFVFISILFSLKYFDLIYAHQGILKNISYGFMLMSIIISIPYIFKKKGGFILPIQLISFSIAISILMAEYTWDQGFEYSPTTIPYAMWFVFFYLLHLKVSIKFIEKIIVIYGIVYIILFLFQLTHNNTVYFGNTDEFKIDRGVVRINFPGTGVFFLSCYIALNKITSAKKYKLLWLMYSLTGIIVITLQVTRQSIFCLLLMYSFHLMKNLKTLYKTTTIIFFTISVLLFINSDTQISKGLIEQQKDDISAGEKYIRILSAEYFLTEFTPNTISKFLGNGFYNDTSKYGKRLIEVSNTYGFYLSDVGLVEVYIVFGIFAVLGYVIIFAKSITISLPADYQYLKYYLWTIMLTSLTSDALISYNFLITTVIVLYCYQSIYEYKKRMYGILLEFNNQKCLNL